MSESTATPPEPFKTKCKFVCENVVGLDDGRPNNNQVSWFFRPDTKGSKEHEWVPAGSLQISVNKNEYKGLHPVKGMTITLDLEEIPAPEKTEGDMAVTEAPDTVK